MPQRDNGTFADTWSSVAFAQNVIVPIFLGLVVLIFAWGFLKYLWSAGHEGEREKGKKLMLWGVAGILLITLMWGILEFIGGYAGS